MTTLRRLKDVIALEQFGMILEKAESQAEIAQALEKNGYSPTLFHQGMDFLGKARKKYKENLVEMAERFNKIFKIEPPIDTSLPYRKLVDKVAMFAAGQAIEHEERLNFYLRYEQEIFFDIKKGLTFVNPLF